MDTSDFCAYRDVLIVQDKQYVPDAPDFSPATIMDVGANIGMASILFARKYPSAKIIAIEPEPSNFAALVKNTLRYTNIVPIQAALWKENGHVALGESEAHPKGAFEIVEGGAERVRAITMETLMRETGISSIDLLKMDIEGAEREVFKDCAWIKHVGVIAIELHDRLKPGCRSAVETAAVGFRSDQRGEVTFFVRKPHLE
jgi:FkbM family methyltransferase